MAGILPFGAVFIELFFIFSAIWQNQFYYLFGFLFLVFCILVVSCGQIAIVMTYFQLCGEVCLFKFYFKIFFLIKVNIFLGLSMVVEEFRYIWRISCLYIIL